MTTKLDTSNMLMVLSDGETFGGAIGSYILIPPALDTLSDDDRENLYDGRLPDSSDKWPYIWFGRDKLGNFVAEVKLDRTVKTVTLVNK